MARIRQIKPEFWDSPSTAAASAVARLLFIAMWNWADDSGHGTGNLKELEGFAFPNDDVSELSGGKCRNFRHCVADVCGSFGVVFYNVRGRMYYEIPSWTNHQRNERLAKGKHPLPKDGEIVDMTAIEDPPDNESRKMSELPTHNHGSSVPVSEEQSNRGTGFHRELELRTYVTSVEKQKSAEAVKISTLRIVNHWIDQQNNRPPGKVINDVKAQIAPMIQDGIEINHIAAGLTQWWEGNYPASTIPNYVRVAQRGTTKTSTGTQRATDILNIDTSEIQEEP